MVVAGRCANDAPPWRLVNAPNGSTVSCVVARPTARARYQMAANSRSSTRTAAAYNGLTVARAAYQRPSSTIASNLVGTDRVSRQPRGGRVETPS
jgi:hypothetical protein